MYCPSPLSGGIHLDRVINQVQEEYEDIQIRARTKADEDPASRDFEVKGRLNLDAQTHNAEIDRQENR